MTEPLIQEAGVQEPRSYTHCMRCRRSFKKPKTVPFGPVCAKKAAERAQRAAGIVA
jgi:hypothetical protein